MKKTNLTKLLLSLLIALAATHANSNLCITLGNNNFTSLVQPLSEDDELSPYIPIPRQ